MTNIVIVGGVAGGATAAARIRRLDEQANITIFERGEYVSFANCGLPYHIGKVIPKRENLLLQTPQGFYERYRVNVMVQHEVVAIDRAAKSVHVKNLQSGEEFDAPYDKLILAPGAHPTMPPANEDAREYMFALHTMADMDAINEHIQRHNVKRVAVMGGGFIGLEAAENLKELGLDVCLIQRSAQVLPPLDLDMAGFAHEALRAGGIDLMLNSPVDEIRVNDSVDGLAIQLKDGNIVNAELLIAALGVKPLSALAVEAGLEVDKTGGVITDEHMQTTDPNIYAVGDVVAVKEFVTQDRRMIALAGPANKQARIAADNICGISSTFKGSQGSAIIKLFNKTAAFTGLNEKAAKAAGLSYDKVYLYSPSHASYYPGATDMLAKVLFDTSNGRILGAQIFGGEGVDKRCDVLAIAIRAGLTPQDLKELELCYAPPYGSAKEPANVVGNMIDNVLQGTVKQHHWHDVAEFPRDGSVQLVDVRTAAEYADGHIDGYINIAVDDLRERMGELDKSKPLYIHCHSGLRSYIAARILMQNGFQVSHMNGGWRLYKSLHEAHLC